MTFKNSQQLCLNCEDHFLFWYLSKFSNDSWKDINTADQMMELPSKFLHFGSK